MWPGVTRLRDWHEFPQWKAQDLNKVIPQLDPHGIDLLQKMLVRPHNTSRTVLLVVRLCTLAASSALPRILFPRLATCSLYS